MSHHKLKKFTELVTLSNTIQLDPIYKGKWRSAYFKNENPITLELACGKGEYTLELARRFPNRNFIGVDIKGDRIWRGAKLAWQEGLTNVVFLRIYIDHILDYFEPNEVSEIWITFPDPYPRGRNIRKRLTAPKFIKLYREILADGGRLHFKTDEPQLFDYTKKVLKTEKVQFHSVIEDLYKSEAEDELLFIQTTFEKKHLAEGLTIRYLCIGF